MLLKIVFAVAAIVVLVVAVFVNMDRFLGGEFEKGLTSMKSVAEASAKK